MSLQSITDDLVIRQGSTWRDSYTCLDGDDLAVSLVGCTAAMHVRATPKAREPLLVLTSENGGLAIDAPGGVIVRQVTDDQTAGLPVGTWQYDLFLTFPSGEAFCIAVGSFTVQARITQL